jgi:hypothetical protein
MDKKPSVFPKTNATTNTNVVQSEEERIAQFEAEKKQVTNYIYEQSKSIPANVEELPENYNVNGHMSAVDMMKMRTQQQMAQRDSNGMVQDVTLAEKQTNRIFQQPKENKDEELMRLRDEQLRINQENIEKYQQQANQASARNNENTETNSGLYQQNQQTNKFKTKL